MNIAIIGNGRVGGALGNGWAKAGHNVVFGERGQAADAAAKADVVVLAVPDSAVPEVAGTLGEMMGKILVDCTNPLVGAQPQSIAEQLAARLPGARVVKAFNTTGSENMADPNYGDQPLTMLYAGDDSDAKQTVHMLAADLGFEPVDAGGLNAARHLEALAGVWIHLALRQKMGRDIGFCLLRR